MYICIHIYIYQYVSMYEYQQVITHKPACIVLLQVPPFVYGLRHRLTFWREVNGNYFRVAYAHGSMLLDRCARHTPGMTVNPIISSFSSFESATSNRFLTQLGLCMYLYRYMYRYIGIYVYNHICIKYIYAHTHTHTHTHIYICIYAYIYIYIYINDK